SPGVGGGHGRRHPGLVDKNQPLGLNCLHLSPERAALLLDIGSVALVGMLGLFLAGDVELPQASPDDHETSAEIEVLTHLCEGRVRPLPDHRSEPLQTVVIERGWLAAAMRPGIQRTGLVAELEEPCDGGDVDAKPCSDLATGSLAVVDGGED